MNWKAEAIEKLKGYNAHKAAIVNLRSELEALRVSVDGLRSSASDGLPGACGAGSEDALIGCIVKQQELERQLVLAECWVATVERGLSVLTREQARILDAIYITRRRNAVDQLCDELCCERPTVYRKRDTALRRFVLALYGAGSG